MRQMRDLDTADKGDEFTLEDVLLFGKLYGKRGQSRLKTSRQKIGYIPIYNLLAEKKR